MKTKAVIITGVALLVLTAGYYLACFGGGDGEVIYKREGCLKCHVLRGEGLGTVDLTGVTQEHSDDWIREQITDARRHNPDSGMPRFGHLGKREINALIRFMDEGAAPPEK